MLVLDTTCWSRHQKVTAKAEILIGWSIANSSKVRYLNSENIGPLNASVHWFNIESGRPWCPNRVQWERSFGFEPVLMLEKNVPWIICHNKSENDYMEALTGNKSAGYQQSFKGYWQNYKDPLPKKQHSMSYWKRVVHYKRKTLSFTSPPSFSNCLGNRGSPKINKRVAVWILLWLKA